MDALEPVRDVITRHLAELSLPGVLTIRAGYKFTGGWPVTPPTPAIVVTVTAKTDAPPGGLLPAAVEGVPTDVRQASDRKRRQVAALAAGAAADTVPLAPDNGGVPEFPDEIIVGVPAPAGPPAPVPAEHFAAAAKPQLAYTGPGIPLAPVTGPVTVQAAASPDAGWPVLKAFLASVQDTLTIGLYDWTSAHVLQWFTQSLAGKAVRLVLDHPAKNATADQTDEQTVTALEAALQANLTQAWALERDDPLAAAWLFPSAYHIKVAVADHQRVWLSSGNWNNSNQPDIDPVNVPADRDAARSGDRDWHVVIDSAALAGVFEAYLANDYAVAAQHQAPPAADTGARTELAGTPAAIAADAETPPFAQFWAPTEVTGTLTVTPVLTPDPGSYAAQVTALIAAATTSLDMQFQYMELPAGGVAAAAPEFLGLLQAVAARQQAGVTTRIIMSEYETTGDLEQLIPTGLIENGVIRLQNNVHNKGIIVDGTTVLVSSQNWSNAGTTQNRDAGVIIESEQLAQYFQQIFEHDWNTLATLTPADD